MKCPNCNKVMERLEFHPAGFGSLTSISYLCENCEVKFIKKFKFGGNLK